MGGVCGRGMGEEEGGVGGRRGRCEGGRGRCGEREGEVCDSSVYPSLSPALCQANAVGHQGTSHAPNVALCSHIRPAHNGEGEHTT